MSPVEPRQGPPSYWLLLGEKMSDRHLSQSKAVAPLVANGLLGSDSGSVRGQYFTVLGQLHYF